MCNEIEAKLKVDSVQLVADKLAELGGEFIEEQRQRDYYYDHAGESLLKADQALRVRLQLTGENEKVFLTHKGAKEKDQFKKRKEIELEVSDFESADKMFLRLGYHKALVVEKKRRLWRFGGCLVCLDEVEQLGDFVEIEGPDDAKIMEVQKKLGLGELGHICEGYAVLLREKLGGADKE